MREISRSKHTKLKNTKIYSKGVLAGHTKISTNENFPLYGSFESQRAKLVGDYENLVGDYEKLVGDYEI